MKITILILLSVLVLSGCTKTVFVPYRLPPSLTSTPDMPHLRGDTNAALYEYALECRASMQMCETKMTIIRELQDAYD